MNRLNRIAPILAVLLLVAMGLGNLTRPGPQDAAPYHGLVARAAETIPYQIGEWVGSDVPAPPEAVEMLRPNVMVSRTFRHSQTGRTATFLLVHCKDARDMAGHYPPVCYPAHGWTQSQVSDRTWTVRGLTIPGREYLFTYQRPEGTSQMIVMNFFIMPDGQILRDNDQVRRAAADYTMHFYGAAQIQVVTSAAVPREQRDAIFRELVGANLNLIETIREGVEPRPNRSAGPMSGSGDGN